MTTFDQQLALCLFAAAGLIGLDYLFEWRRARRRKHRARRTAWERLGRGGSIRLR